jgi:hypothetical protein
VRHSRDLESYGRSIDRPDDTTPGRTRAINRRQQGDLGEASAIEWFSRLGAAILIPFGHSPDYDLVVDIEGRLLRVQVKTCTRKEPRRDGSHRWYVALATNGGNQSWTGVAKLFDPSRFDLLFVLVGDGRRWMIPSDVIEGTRAVNLGGLKYAEFEVDPGHAIDHLVYRDDASKLDPAGGVSKRSKGAGCKPVGITPSQVRLLPPPLPPRGSGFEPSKYDRRLSRSGQTTINEKRKVTLPRKAVIEAGLDVGDRLRVCSHGYGRVLLERIGIYDSWPEEA